MHRSLLSFLATAAPALAPARAPARSGLGSLVLLETRLCVDFRAVEVSQTGRRSRLLRTMLGAGLQSLAPDPLIFLLHSSSFLVETAVLAHGFFGGDARRSELRRPLRGAQRLPVQPVQYSVCGAYRYTEMLKLSGEEIIGVVRIHVADSHGQIDGGSDPTWSSF